jgi:hypothetical protein
VLASETRVLFATSLDEIFDLSHTEASLWAQDWGYRRPCPSAAIRVSPEHFPCKSTPHDQGVEHLKGELVAGAELHFLGHTRRFATGTDFRPVRGEIKTCINQRMFFSRDICHEDAEIV